MTIVAIHQPNFFPWLPFFEKIQASDVFVILRHCQFEKNNYQNRFHYRDVWRTMSTNKGLESIMKKRYIEPVKDWNKIKVNLKDKKHILDQFDDCISNNLFETNNKIILRMMDKLGIKTPIEYDEPTELLSTDRLVKICKDLKATTYLAGIGGKKYMELEKFAAEGISVVFQETPADKKIHTLDAL